MKIKNIIRIYILVLLLIICLTEEVFAMPVTNHININKHLANQFEEVGNNIFSVVRVVGILASVMALMLMGIKYMIGSIEEKAEYKKTFPVYLIGCILVFAISSLAGIVYTWIESLM